MLAIRYKKATLRSFIFFLVAALLVLSLVIVNAQKEDEKPSKDGKGIKLEKTGMGLFNISDEISRVGQKVEYTYSNASKYSGGMEIAFVFPDGNAVVDYIEVIRAVQKNRSVSNYSRFNITAGNGSVIGIDNSNHSSELRFENETVRIATAYRLIGGKDYYIAPFSSGEKVSAS